jgi:hypothetical protein
VKASGIFAVVTLLAGSVPSKQPGHDAIGASVHSFLIVIMGSARRRALVDFVVDNTAGQRRDKQRHDPADLHQPRFPG